MANIPTNFQVPSRDEPVFKWLLDSDPAIRWQVLQDIAAASPDEIAAERARVATQGLGAALLKLQGVDGTWAGKAWNHGWNSTMHVLTLLREFGLDPASSPAKQALELVNQKVTWRDCGPEECAENTFFAGEVEPCINGQVGAAGAYFGQNIQGIVDRLLKEQLPDGGWNCEAENGSTRSSFNTTIDVLDALLEYELNNEKYPEVTAARLRGQEYLLERQLMQRRSTGEAIQLDRKDGSSWFNFAYPNWWHYDILRGLDYLRRAGVMPDVRMAKAIDLVLSRRGADGKWRLDTRYPGVMPLELDEGTGQPNRWITLRALRVLKWYFGREA